MSVELDLRRLGGIARVRDLKDRGRSGYVIAKAVDRGRVYRPLRGWVALTDADPVLILAARRAAVLTCVTQAARLGLWTFSDAVPHFGMHSSHGRSIEGEGVVHWARPLVPRAPGSLTDPIENVLAQVAACQPYESALTIWESALNKGLVDQERLRRLPFTGAAGRLLEESGPYSDSGLESLVRARLRWLRVPVRPQIWILGHRVDFLIGERLVLQIDGGHHVGAQRTADIRHDAELMLRGYRVIRVSYEQVVRHWAEVQELVMGAIARGEHLAV